MAKKKTSENQSVDGSADEIGTKQVRLPNDLVAMIEEMVGRKKGAVGKFIAEMIRVPVAEKHKRWFIERGRTLGLNLRE